MIDMQKMKDMDCNTKAHWISFWVCLLVAIFLMVGSALVPPMFIIDASIFKGVAWLFGFAALAQVPSIVQSGKTAILQHGNTSLTVGDNKPKHGPGPLGQEMDFNEDEET